MNGEERAKQSRARSLAYDMAEVAAGLREFDDAWFDIDDEAEVSALIVAQARLSALLAAAYARTMPDRSRADVLRMLRTEAEVVAGRRELEDLDGFPFDE